MSQPTSDDQPATLPVSVVVTVLNEAASIDALLAALAAQTAQPGEIVIVDAGSTDGTRELLAAWARRLPLRVIDAPGASISAGRNLAIASATHEIVAVTDAGTRPTPGWLAAITARLLATPDDPAAPAVVSGWFVGDPCTIFETAMAATVLPDLAEIEPERFLPSSRSIAFRKAAWRSVGGYPEWLDYCEDLVFDLRLRDVGLPVAFVPAAMVRFRPRSSLRAFWRQYWTYARGDGKAGLWRRRHLIRYVSYAAPVAVGLAWPRLGSLARAVVGVALLLGGTAYLARPYARLLPALGRLGWRGRLAALALVPLIRAVGDLAKMGGYPVGLWWRARRHGLHRGWREIEPPTTPPPTD